MAKLVLNMMVTGFLGAFAVVLFPIWFPGLLMAKLVQGISEIGE